MTVSPLASAVVVSTDFGSTLEIIDGPSGGEAVVNPDGTINPHYFDQLILYGTWRYKDMYLDKGDLKGNRESKEVVRFGGKSNKKSKKTAINLK